MTLETHTHTHTHGWIRMFLHLTWVRTEALSRQDFGLWGYSDLINTAQSLVWISSSNPSHWNHHVDFSLLDFCVRAHRENQFWECKREPRLHRNLHKGASLCCLQQSVCEFAKCLHIWICRMVLCVHYSCREVQSVGFIVPIVPNVYF